MIYRNTIWLFLLTCFLSFSCKEKIEVLVAKKPNIVLILTDDQGWGDLSLHGNPNISTPNIDRLASNGAEFLNFYVSPVCSPTRAELLTGRFHPRCGVYSTSEGGERIDLDEKLISEVFLQAGYKTGAFGKWHSGMQYPYHPNGRGFEEFYGFCSGHWGHYFDTMMEHNGEIITGQGYMPDDLTNRAIEFMKNSKESPFFVYLPYNTPHSPMQVPNPWWQNQANNELSGSHYKSDEENINHTKAALAMCENIDWNVGRLMDYLTETNQVENTIFIYLSDNGPNGWRWNGGLKGRKGSTDEGGVKSPLIVQWPNTIKAGLKINQISSAIDLFPTLCDLANIPFQLEKPLDGMTFKSLLLGEKVNWEDRFVYNYFRDNLSVRDQRFLLDNENRLYDLQSDPSQLQDISGQQNENVARLLEQKEYYKKEVISELPNVDARTFPVGHPDFKFSQIPARDGHPHGNIQRSNRWPNCSFFTNWKSENDHITWDIEVLESGNYEVVIYYTCRAQDVGSTFQLQFGENTLSSKISVAHDPPLIGMAEDRDEREESYVKDFKPLSMGTITLEKGTGILNLQALEISGEFVMDFRLLVLNKV